MILEIALILINLKVLIYHGMVKIAIVLLVTRMCILSCLFLACFRLLLLINFALL